MQSRAASPKIAAALEAREYRATRLAAAAELRAPVDRFFDEVLVMADDAQVRATGSASCSTCATLSARSATSSQIPR